MASDPEQETTVLAEELLRVVPRLLRRLRADLPLEQETTDPELRDISELRATIGQLTLLRVLYEHERCMMQELAEHLAVVPSTVTAMVKRLLAQGYVERLRDDVDWRTVWVKLTERGRHVMERYDQARLVTLQQRLEQLTTEERNNLLQALPALQRLIEE